MGNVSSDCPSESSVLTTTSPTYEGFTSDSNNSPVISMDNFLRKLDDPLKMLGSQLWKQHAESDVMHLKDYNTLLSNLRSSTNKLVYFIHLIVGNAPSPKPDYVIDILLSWFLMGMYDKSTNLRDVIQRHALSLLTEDDHLLTEDEMASRLNPLYADSADDLAKLVVSNLTIPSPVALDFTISSEFTNLLTPTMLWALSVLLTCPFKRPSDSRLGRCTAPLEIEQLSHLINLYESAIHGFSLTRIRESAFDYAGPLILLIRTKDYLFCLASDHGLRDSLKTYGFEASKLIMFLPEFKQLVSGRSSKSNGIIYTNFTARTSRRGLLVGHQPLAYPVIEINEDFTNLRFTGGAPMKLTAVELWAAGSVDQMDRFKGQKDWENRQVQREKNRKLKLDEDWRQGADRHLLSMAGIQVKHSDQIGPHEEAAELPNDPS